MRSDLLSLGRDWDSMFDRLIGAGSSMMSTPGYQVPTDVFHMEDRLVVRMDLPEVDPDDVEVTIQENTLLVNGARRFPHDASKIRWVRRGCFYGDFTQRIALGKGLATDKIGARYDKGVLELTIPYAEEVQPRKISIEIGDQTALAS